jgi:hypothetical protein
VVVILIQTSNLLGLFGTLQLSVHITMLRTVVRFHPQATIGPSCRLLASEAARDRNAPWFFPRSRTRRSTRSRSHVYDVEVVGAQ